MHFLAENPDAYARLQAEVDDFYDTNDLTSPITYVQAQQLPYLRAIISESLRLYPSIPYQLPRRSPGFSIDNHFVPENYTASISPMAQNRDLVVYGQDRNDFKPLRWLENSEKTRYLESRDMTFGGNGLRSCTGKKYSIGK